MAISAAAVWEVRSAGSDSSGGGFVAGASGTDFSQQDAAQYNGTDLTVDATTNTKVTSAGHSFVAADVGNLMQITAGAGFTTGFYQIASVASGAATLDRSPAATSTSGGTYAVGGALASVSKLAGAMVASNKAFIKSGTYTSSAVITFAQTVTSPSHSSPPTQLVGYATTRGDVYPGSANASSRPQVLVTTLNASVLTFSNTGWLVQGLIVGPSGVATCGAGLTFSSTFGTVVNCKVSAFSAFAIRLVGNASSAQYCEITGGTAGTGIDAPIGTSSVLDCWSHDHSGSCLGINGGGTECLIAGNLVSNCTGASGDGIQAGAGAWVLGNTVYKSGRDGIRLSGTTTRGMVVRGNLVAENGGYGLNYSTGAGTPARWAWDGNAFYLNTSGTRNNLDDTATNAQDAVSPYTNTLDVILTADPFVAKASNDFRLNTTAGGGAACRGHGVPTGWPGNSLTTSSPDMGCAQSAVAAGGPVGSNMRGGFSNG